MGRDNPSTSEFGSPMLDTELCRCNTCPDNCVCDDCRFYYMPRKTALNPTGASEIIFDHRGCDVLVFKDGRVYCKVRATGKAYAFHPVASMKAMIKMVEDVDK